MRRIFIFCTTLVALCVLGSTASAGIIYTVENAGVFPETVISPLAKAQSAPDFYDYRFEGASGRPGDFTVEDTAFFWLYEDTDTGVLSLGMVFDKRNANPGPNDTGGRMNLTTAGMPGGVSITVQDDDGDIENDDRLINGTESWGWNNHNTDGAMISGFENLLWTVTIDINSFQGLNGFYFLDGPNSMTPTPMTLDPGNQLILRAKLMDMPEPASMTLFGFGLAALGFVRRRRA